MGIRFQRGNFIVSNLDRALAFYRDVLGFELTFVKDSPDDSYSYDVFEIPKGTPLKFAILSTPDQPRVMALTEIPGIEPAPTPRRSAIVLDIEDIDGLLERARAGGFHVYREEELHTHDGRVGREIGLLDDDGNLTVIYRING
ncbi:MAG: VOC family protein [Pseudomonadota bacterium]